jgi:hypothetical protein
VSDESCASDEPIGHECLWRCVDRVTATLAADLLAEHHIPVLIDPPEAGVLPLATRFRVLVPAGALRRARFHLEVAWGDEEMQRLDEAG